MIPRDKLSYMRELGEGEFGKVLLMQAKVSSALQVHSLRAKVLYYHLIQQETTDVEAIPRH